METQFAVISTEYVELALNYVCCVATTRTRFVVTRLNLFPMICLNIKHMNIVHPMHTIITSKVIDFRINKAACSRYTCVRLLTCDLRGYPGKCLCIQVEDIIQLPILVWFSTEYENFLLICYGRVLKSSIWSYTVSLDWPTPF